MPVVNNSGYNNPQIGQAFSSLASMFAPDTTQEILANKQVQVANAKAAADAAAEERRQRFVAKLRDGTATLADQYDGTGKFDPTEFGKYQQQKIADQYPDDLRRQDAKNYANTGTIAGTVTGSQMKPVSENQVVYTPGMATGAAGPTTQYGVLKNGDRSTLFPNGQIQPAGSPYNLPFFAQKSSDNGDSKTSDVMDNQELAKRLGIDTGLNGVTSISAPDKDATPVLKDVRLSDGSTQPTWVKPGEAAGTPLGAPAKPDAVDPAKLAEERAKNVAKAEADAASRGQQAELMLPHIDRATRSYQTLVDQNAIGPVSASGPSRTVGGVIGTQAEAARQEFEAAAKEIELAKAQISMKGQGAISDSERKILAFTLPRLDAADPKVGLRTLQQMRDAAVGNMTKAGKAAPAQATGLASPQSAADYAALPSGTKFTAPDGSVRIKP